MFAAHKATMWRLYLPRSSGRAANTSIVDRLTQFCFASTVLLYVPLGRPRLLLPVVVRRTLARVMWSSGRQSKCPIHLYLSLLTCISMYSSPALPKSFLVWDGFLPENYGNLYGTSWNISEFLLHCFSYLPRFVSVHQNRHYVVVWNRISLDLQTLLKLLNTLCTLLILDTKPVPSFPTLFIILPRYTKSSTSSDSSPSQNNFLSVMAWIPSVSVFFVLIFCPMPFIAVPFFFVSLF